jgi:hypothetical protein
MRSTPSTLDHWWQASLTPQSLTRQWAFVLWLGTFLVFAAHGAWPTPDSNETHYLGKARHTWDSTWCAGDLFLESRDFHKTFGWVFGWVAKLCTLEAAAWIGRLLTWGLLAWGWQRLATRLLARAEFGPLAAALFVMLTERTHMAGEWIVGGVEAKGFAFVLILGALSEMVVGRWKWVFPLLGGASLFHVLVGGWATLAALVTWAIVGRKQVSFTQLMLPLFAGGLLALPSLWWGIQLTRDIDPQTVAEANKLYVLIRLPHHLYPPQFAPGFVMRHMLTMLVTAGLLALLTGFPWAYMQRPKRRVLIDSGATGSASAVEVGREAEDTSRASGTGSVTPDLAAIYKARWQALAVFVMTTAGIALVGMSFLNLFPAEDPKLLALLRYYWFRASDIYVPLGAALATWRCVELLIPRFPLPAIVAYVLLSGTLVWDLTEQIAHWPFDVPGIHTAKLDARPDVLKATEEWSPADWRDMCQKIREKTPSNAKFLTPRQGRTFKWHAQRAEVVTNKDIPQDAPAIMRWWEIQDEIYATHSGDPDHKWHRSLGVLPVERLREIAEKYNAQYVVIHYRPGVPEFPLTPLYRNQTFGVYQLR